MPILIFTEFPKIRFTISPKALTDSAEQLDVLLAPKLCQMPSVKVFLFPQRSCLGKLAQVHVEGVPLVHSPWPRAPSRLGKRNEGQQKAKCSRQQIVKIKM